MLNTFTNKIFNSNTISSTAVVKPISVKDEKNKKNEIFVDIFEKINVI